MNWRKRASLAWRRWRDGRRLQRENQYYLREFSQRGLSLDQPVRLPQTQPKPKGSLSIGAIFHHYTWESTAFLPALTAFGHVTHFDPALPQTSQDQTDRPDPSLAIRLAQAHALRPFDVLFFYVSPYLARPETLRTIRQLGVPMVNMNLNDKEAFVGKIRSGLAMGVRDICRFFDLNWTSTEDALIKYAVEGAAAIYLPEAANPHLFFPVDTAKDLDVSFVGANYGHRPNVINFLRSQGFKVHTFGPGWPEGKIPTETMRLIYSRSRVNLGFASVGDFRDTFCLKGRDFEVPMSGGCYLTEDHPELRRVFRVGQEIETYRTRQELVDKLHTLLQEPNRAAAMGRAARARCLQEHTWEKRFETLFSTLAVMSGSTD
ncbi:MAG: glycosyltransferase [Verrucomicrobiia bacterium]